MYYLTASIVRRPGVAELSAQPKGLSLAVVKLPAGTEVGSRLTWGSLSAIHTPVADGEAVPFWLLAETALSSWSHRTVWVASS